MEVRGCDGVLTETKVRPVVKSARQRKYPTLRSTRTSTSIPQAHGRIAFRRRPPVPLDDEQAHVRTERKPARFLGRRDEADHRRVRRFRRAHCGVPDSPLWIWGKSILVSCCSLRRLSSSDADDTSCEKISFSPEDVDASVTVPVAVPPTHARRKGDRTVTYDLMFVTSSTVVLTVHGTRVMLVSENTRRCAHDCST